MKQIRKNIFETNSSSTHSVSIANPKLNYDQLIDYVNPDDNMIHIQFGEFGWGYDEYEDAYNKLAYLLTMILETRKATFCRGGITTIDEYYMLDEFILVESIVTENTPGCKGICIDNDGFKFNEYDDPDIDIKNESHGYLDHNGYIDHQSCEDYESLNDFLEDWGTNITDFIFNENIQLVIDNDNH